MILRDHGFDREERLSADWNIFWCAGQVEPTDLRQLKPHQKVNKFPKASALTLKSNLYAHFARMQRLHGEAKYGYMPQTFIMPNQAAQFEEALNQDVANDVSRPPHRSNSRLSQLSRRTAPTPRRPPRRSDG